MQILNNAPDFKNEPDFKNAPYFKTKRAVAFITAVTAGVFALFFVTSLVAMPPPAPDSTSTLNQSVTNPVTGLTTTVNELVTDPAGTPTAGNTAFVATADGYYFLVKNVGEKLYVVDDGNAVAFNVTAKNAANVFTITHPTSGSQTMAEGITAATYNANFSGANTTIIPVAPVSVTGVGGVRDIVSGSRGGNGRSGVFFIPPSSGGNGSDGPTVSKTLSTNVNVVSPASPGIRHGWEVGSVGGNGGDGGDSILSFWSARSGGNAGDGGNLTATQTANSTVSTDINNYHGIYAYSQSGTGGDGGDAILAISGGEGGSGGHAGKVTLNQNGTVTTGSEGSFGVFAQSVSKKAGNGGDQWGFVGKAGNAGKGADGDDVQVTSTGVITTGGHLSHGLLAQSIGGSGGDAGTSGNLLVSLSGETGNGGNSGDVTVTNSGTIQTGGSASKGLYAQSVGGGGGTGSDTVGLVAIALGGQTSAGGKGGVVRVTNTKSGEILTEGAGSDGIFAQSVGGSGSTSGFSGGLVAIGGNGGAAGDGAAVTVENFGKIQTNGTARTRSGITTEGGSRGLFAQSIGGGGGDGGNTGGMVAVGGSGGGGGKGGVVTVTNDGSIQTRGKDSTGLYAQSVGGGGGNGGSSGSVGLFAGVAVGGTGGTGNDGGRVKIDLSNSEPMVDSLIQTLGDRSKGVFAQSVGGGGGSGGGAVQGTVGVGAAISIALGGDGGVGGDGGEVQLTGKGISSIATNGEDATGLTIQSVGGGGGSGGYSVALAASANAGPSGSLSVSVGGNGNAGGEGGRVIVGEVDGTGAVTAAGFEGAIATTGNRSTGMMIQSVGGGGGNSGTTVSAALAASPVVAGSVSVGVGGAGGAGGNGGEVTVKTKASVSTQGDLSTGMIVQSVGGGGGSAGGTITAGLNAAGAGSGSLGVSVGGNGGKASTGGKVVLSSEGTSVDTQGDNSAGILAQSVGGGGGNGGYAITAGLNAGGGGAGSVNVGLGGKGGAGGNAGQVTATVANNVKTTGESSDGVIVQAIGGGGGNGGFNIGAGVNAGGAGAGSVTVGLGGGGSEGGEGGTVNADISGNVETKGPVSTGILMQSVGGGGGNGGFNVTGNLSAAGAGAGGVNVGLGGSGAKGGNGKSVTGSVSGTVTTGTAGGVSPGIGLAGFDSSAGVLAQSIGGGGGNGGFNVTASVAAAGLGAGSIDVGLGGKGGAGGTGGQVDLTTLNSILSFGTRSDGVLAQSIGGGGGNGGFNVTGAISAAGKGAGNISVGLGGSGGVAGNADTVRLTTQGTVKTEGSDSKGVVGQSIGGGGGNGGFNVTSNIAGAGFGAGNIAVGLGGGGGVAGDGKKVTVSTSADVETSGAKASEGVLAQSVGGGGGNGGFNVTPTISAAGKGSGSIGVGIGGSGGAGGAGGEVDLTVTNNVKTAGAESSAVVAQSIGGGGGNGGFNVTVTGSGAGVGAGSIGVGIGGAGGGGSNAGKVQSRITGDLTTLGKDSKGLLAQSVGGGGGNGGFNVTAGLNAAGTGAGGIAFGLGGYGGDGGHAGEVDNKIVGTVKTSGENATGVMAQSLGGGGGNGGLNISGSISAAGTGSGGISVGIGGVGGDGGDGNKVTNDVEGDVTTSAGQSSAANATGVIAQSIGGGGGNGGLNVSAAVTLAGTGSGGISVGIGGSGGGGGDGKAVENTVKGNVTTKGDESEGILVQSAGGGGGKGAINVSAAISGAGTGAGSLGFGLGGAGGGGGNGAEVNNRVTGNIKTEGENATGMNIQSVGGGGGAGGLNVTATIGAAGKGAGALGIGIGGFGGDGGHAGAVTSTLNGDVETNGADSAGVSVQSVGGGGGTGGLNVTAAIGAAGTGGGAVGIGIGGFGGDGGHAGAVTSTLNGDVKTNGADSAGVSVQSVGGGGGAGGVNVSAAVGLSGKGAGAVSFGLGGAGGGGGNAAAVNNTVQGTVSTQGTGSGGVITQSLGGGGGTGGLNVSGTIVMGADGAGALGIGIGGFGGDGGSAGTVTAKGTGSIQTDGIDSAGFHAQSTGGGGGIGGVNVTGTITAAKKSSGSLSFGLGGFGGDGGDAGTLVDAAYEGRIETLKNSSAAFIAESVGGGGGSGGLNVTGNINASKQKGGSVALGVGGFGGGGGAGKDVTASVKSTDPFTGGIRTRGDSSDGIVAQSRGGGGGSGGLNVSGAVNLTGEDGAAVSLGVGGFGGDGGSSGDVVLVTEANVITSGNNSDGVFAQSVGGGGGKGGVNISGALSINKPDSSDTIVTTAIGLGGFGGKGGDSGKVDVDFSGTISATADAVADTGITEENRGSNGLVAQSIGGGGGNGGLNVSGGVGISMKPSAGLTDKSKSYGVILGFGGFGGDGGNSGAVTVDVTKQTLSGGSQANSTIVGSGKGKSGILAQSIGGGGGNGAINISGGVISDSSLIVGVGGGGGGGGIAKSVIVNAKADVRVSSKENLGTPSTGDVENWFRETLGDETVDSSVGLFENLQLLTGIAGLVSDMAGFVSGTNDVAKDPQLERGFGGVVAQSIGGGGGNGATNISGGINLDRDGKVPSLTFGIGGFGGAGNVSDEVKVDHEGSIDVSGRSKHGLFAQSIAGGGGNGGLNISGQLNFSESERKNGRNDLAVVAGIGGHGGAGADAGLVDVKSTGDISVAGYDARGLFAQSVGGGGGTGGMNITAISAQNSSPFTLGIGGFGKGGGHASTVTVARGTAAAAAGKITTDGDGGHGIEATSIGGGGGDGGANLILSVSKTKGAESGAGDSTDQKQTISAPTKVDPAAMLNFQAVLAQLEESFNDKGDVADKAPGDAKNSQFAAVVSVGGQGGDAGNGAAVDVDHFGDIETRKKDSNGVLAQSIGGGGGNANMNLALVFQTGDSRQNRGVALTLGGATGDGGKGDTVDVDNVGDIATQGDNSAGILAQSVGGGGGNAGMDLTVGSTDGGSVALRLGRTGGTGGAGDKVTLNSKGAITTTGKKSYGLLAQSIGNGGGNSGTRSLTVETAKDNLDENTTVSVAVGLEGGIGGKADTVKINAQGSVSTKGEDSHGVFAQSVGGGGGNGGTATGTTTESRAYALSVGGFGGSGGTGGAVDVINSSIIGTEADRSIGVFAQSVGGAGGTGGAVAAGLGVFDQIKAIKGNDKTTGTLSSLSIGGFGGEGMLGGAVTVKNTGIITTGKNNGNGTASGEDSHGILAQSVGGGGGTGGAVISNIFNRGEIDSQQSLSIGGFGDDGGTGGIVEVTNSANIGTHAARSAGIFAQSVGGGGGSGGKIRNIIVALPGAGVGGSEDSSTTSLSIGGTGGSGGAGKEVTVTNEATANIVTLGHQSHGIFAQSVGGGGGNGGSVTHIKSASSQSNSKTAKKIDLVLGSKISVGGKGSTGGTGDHVKVINHGGIATLGTLAHGILAQSVGGGGGAGGKSVSGDLSLVTGDAARPSLNFVMGGSGGSGNTSGDVLVINSGTIAVKNDSSHGILAQSVGGGGGDGALGVALTRDVATNPRTDLKKALSNVAFGGIGGSGADSGNVLVNHTGNIVSEGDNSYGILAQSVGGGGGSGGHSIAAPLWMAVNYAFGKKLGLLNGSDGDAGTATISAIGDISVSGENSHAMLSQSVNGGGGNVDTFLDLSKRAVQIGVDGSEAPPNDGFLQNISGLVTGLTQFGSEQADKLSAQKVISEITGGIQTLKKNASAGIAQSVGGGGGNGSTTVKVNQIANVDLKAVLGAVNTNNSGGESVTTKRTGDVTTKGNMSEGGIAQSIGGGGGRLIMDVVVDHDPGVTGAAGTKKADVTLGADPSFTNGAGTVTEVLKGHISTAGGQSPGRVLQSIGAGGGEILINGFDTVTVKMGAQDDSTGDASTVSLTNTGNIGTANLHSHAVVLQSIGGGGGLVLTDKDPAAVIIDKSAANGGNGGAVNFTNTGAVTASGAGSFGIVAQSLGGGGGTVDDHFMDAAGGVGSGSSIDLNVENVLVTGAESTAVFVQSKGTTGAGDMRVNVDGVVAGGSGDSTKYAAFVMESGATNTLNLSVDSYAYATNNQLAIGTSGNDTVNLSGTAYGNIDLAQNGSSQMDALNVKVGGIFYSRDTINVGDQGTVRVEGSFVPGGTHTPLSGATAVKPADAGQIKEQLISQITDINGSFEATSTATNRFDIYYRNNNGRADSDLLKVTGDATIAGTFIPNLHLLERSGRLTFIEAQGITLDQGTSIAPTAAATYHIEIQPNKINLNIETDFAVDGSDQNQTAIGNYFDDVLISDESRGLGTMFAWLANMQTNAGVIDVLDKFRSEGYAANRTAAYYDSLEFADHANRCRNIGADRTTRALEDCVWASAERSKLEVRTHGYTRNIETVSKGLSGGVQQQYDERTRIGVAVGYKRLDLQHYDNFRSDAERVQFGANIKRFFTGAENQSDTEWHAGLSVSSAAYNSTRDINLSGQSLKGVAFKAEQATLRDRVNTGNLRIGSSGTTQLPNLNAYVKSAIDADLSYIWSRDQTETQTDGFGLTLNETKQVIATLTPSIEIGADTRPGNQEMHVRPYAKAAAQFSTDDDIYVNTRLSNGGPTNQFRNYVDIDNHILDLEVGLDAFNPDKNLFLSLKFNGNYGKNSKEERASVRMGLKF